MLQSLRLQRANERVLGEGLALEEQQQKNGFIRFTISFITYYYHYDYDYVYEYYYYYFCYLLFI